MKRPKKVQLYTYLHQREAQRLIWLAEHKGRGLSETLRAIVYEWMDERRIPYPQSE